MELKITSLMELKFAVRRVKGRNSNKQHALKGQKLIAQGIALGCYGR